MTQPQAKSNIVPFARWADPKTVKAFRKFSKRLAKEVKRTIDPRILLLLCRFHHHSGQLQRGLSIDEAQTFGFARPQLEAMRNVGILDQQRGYRRMETRDGEWATEPEMIPLFFLTEAWAKSLAPMMCLDCVKPAQQRPN